MNAGKNNKYINTIISKSQDKNINLFYMAFTKKKVPFRYDGCCDWKLDENNEKEYNYDNDINSKIVFVDRNPIQNKIDFRCSKIDPDCRNNCKQ